MLSETARKLDLYDFFSILLPGVIFLIGLLPFFPQDWPITSTWNAALLIIAGYVVGRGLEPLSTKSLSGYFLSHREAFTKELNEPRFHTPATIKRFLDRCATFEMISGSDKIGSISTVEGRDLYTFVRSYIHIDGRGRSRTFQAIYSFYRSMLFVSLAWAYIYAYYAIMKFIFYGDFPLQSHIPVSYLGALGDDAVFGAIMASGISFLCVALFIRSQDKYQQYFIQYLISDFLVLETADYPEAIVMAQPSESRFMRTLAETGVEEEPESSDD